MKKIISLICVFSLCAVMLMGCSNKHTVVEQADPVDVTIASLKGPTTMGLVDFINRCETGQLTDNRYNFNIVTAADEITPKLLKGEIDIAAIPANLASVLYNNSEGKIQVMAINTLGVLYVVETGSTVNSVADLKGKTIYATGKGTTPEYALNYILSQNGIDPAKDLTIEWKSEPAECLSALNAQENAIAMLPQPFVTTAQTKNANIRVALDLTKEWDATQQGKDNPSTLVTGVVVARKEFIEQNPDAVNAFLNHYEESVTFVNNNTSEGAKLVSQYQIVSADIAEKALPACNITFIEGADMKTKLSGYLSSLNEQNPKSIGGKMPADDFYFSR